jgi:aerobic-type carbon monoxide dehydrogenase small subunit (CoxS/CutS family)
MCGGTVVNVVLQVNGAAVELDVEPGVMLLEVLRDQLGLLGARGTCGVGLCGACTVLLDGQPVSSCIMLAPLAQGHALTTVEGLADDDPVVQAFDRHHAFQCGYCIPGMVLTAKSFLTECAQAKRCPSREQIAETLGGNLCRCGCYVKIIDAVQEVSS